eukprot:scaffold1367_cov27-Tisochrysis_lutea.AAC.1
MPDSSSMSPSGAAGAARQHQTQDTLGHARCVHTRCDAVDVPQRYHLPEGYHLPEVAQFEGCQGARKHRQAGFRHPCIRVCICGHAPLNDTCVHTSNASVCVCFRRSCVQMWSCAIEQHVHSQKQCLCAGAKNSMTDPGLHALYSAPMAQAGVLRGRESL